MTPPACKVSLLTILGLCVPRGSAIPQPIRIGVPPVDYSPWFDFTGGTNSNERLFLPAFVKGLAQTTQLEFEYVTFKRAFTPLMFYQEVYRGLVLDEYDIVWSTLSPGLDPYNVHKMMPFVPNNGSLTMTPPFYLGTWWALITKTEAPINFLRFMEPFHWTLWLATAAALLVVSAAMVLLHVIAPRQGLWGKFSFHYALSTVYHTWAAFLGGEDFEWLTPSARILRIALLFLVLISVSTYTANLAAFFTKPNFKFIGPQNLAQMTSSTVCMTYSTYADLGRAFAKDVMFPPEDMDTDFSVRAAWCHEQMRSGKASAFVGSDTTLQSFLLQNCKTMARAKDISFLPEMSVFLLRSTKSELIATLADAMLKYMVTPAYNDLLTSSFSMGRSCEEQLVGSDTTEISFAQMQGFFTIFGVLVGIAVLAAVGEATSRRLSGQLKTTDSDGDEGITDAEMILQLSGKVDQILEGINAHGLQAVTRRRADEALTSTTSEVIVV